MAIQFSPAHCQLIAQKRKTQTRRLLVSGKPCRYQPGTTYSVQPGRGQFIVQLRRGTQQLFFPQTRAEAARCCSDPAFADLRIRVFALLREPLHNMTEADSQREGYASVAEYAQEWNRIHTKRGTRWADNPTVWVIDFE